MIVHRRFEIPAADGAPIRGDLRHDGGVAKRPVIVVCHGFKGFKDWGFHPYLGTRLAEAGFAAVHFNFSRNGVGADLLELTDLDAFQRNTPSTELSDLARVLEALRDGLDGEPLDPDRVGLLGHSRGGGIAILGAEAAGPDAIKAVVTWSAIATWHRFGDAAALAAWRERGFREMPNARTGQMMRVGVETLDDIERDGARLDILAAASRLRRPLRLVHGTADESVPYEEARRILACAWKDVAVDLVPVEGAGHTFGAAHPFAGTTDHLEQAISASTGWFRDRL